MDSRRTILSIHNFYRQPGGEDVVYSSEAALLERYGHSVVRYEDDNKRIGSGLSAGLGSIWNLRSHRRLSSLARSRALYVAHFHNIFPLISPAAYYALRSQGVPVVQMLSNYRLLCPGGALLRDGKHCEECIDRHSFLPALTHRCYRGSLPATTAVAATLGIHRIAGTWRHAIDAYIAPTEFVRRKFIDGGFPEDRIFVKPHMVASDPGAGQGSGHYALFVGRLSEEKGIRTLLEAWRGLPNIPLTILGDGPLAKVTSQPGVTWIGPKSRNQTMALMREASVLVVPSVCYETGPLTIVEALACGLPVVASDLGSMAERILHRQNGLLFRPGDSEDLARQVRWAFDNPIELRMMRSQARREYEEKYTPERNYKMLMEIYELAVQNAQKGRKLA